MSKSLPDEKKAEVIGTFKTEECPTPVDLECGPETWLLEDCYIYIMRPRGVGEEPRGVGK